MNLIVNACDAMSDGGTLTVTTSLTHAEKLPSGYPMRPHPAGYILLSIADTGGGIADEDLAKIFEP